MFFPYKWLRPDLVLPSLFLFAIQQFLPGSGISSAPGEIDEQLQNAWRPFFYRNGRDAVDVDGCPGEFLRVAAQVGCYHNANSRWSDAS